MLACGGSVGGLLVLGSVTTILWPGLARSRAESGGDLFLWHEHWHAVILVTKSLRYGCDHQVALHNDCSLACIQGLSLSVDITMLCDNF